MRLEDARGIAAQAWTMPKTEEKIMDGDLAEAFALLLKREVDRAITVKMVVYAAIDSEREYQYTRWVDSCQKANIDYREDDTKTVGEWLMFIKGYYNDAVHSASHMAGSPVMDCFRKLAALCVACMEVHGGYYRQTPGTSVNGTIDLLKGPLTRFQVYEMIDSERFYQDQLGSDRTDGAARTPCDYLAMFDTYLRRAIDGWTENAGSNVALENIRKLAGIAVHAMEDHGVQHRPKYGSPV